MLQFYLAAAQFALGDLPAPTTPSARLTPAVRAQEKLGWRLGLGTDTSATGQIPLAEEITNAAQLRLPYIAAISTQRISKEDPREFNPNLDDASLSSIRLKFEAAGVRLLTYEVADMPTDDSAACRRLFEFGRKMGIETFIASPNPKALPVLDRFCQEFDIRLALLNQEEKVCPWYSTPRALVQACAGRSEHIGACVNVEAWLRSGTNPVKAARAFGNRVLAIDLQDLSGTRRDAKEVPLGTGVGKSAEFLRELARLGVKPTMFSLKPPAQGSPAQPDLTQSIEFFNVTTLKLNSDSRKP